MELQYNPWQGIANFKGLELRLVENILLTAFLVFRSLACITLTLYFQIFKGLAEVRHGVPQVNFNSVLSFGEFNSRW